MVEGQLEEALIMLDAGLEAAEREANLYEQGMLLAERAALARRQGTTNREAEQRAAEIHGSMGIR
jgi:hypothetical protein